MTRRTLASLIGVCWLLSGATASAEMLPELIDRLLDEGKVQEAASSSAALAARCDAPFAPGPAEVAIALGKLLDAIVEYRQAPQGAERIATCAVDQARLASGESSLAMARILDAQGRMLIGLGRYESAEPPLMKALALTEKLAGRESLETASVLVSLASLRSSTTNRIEAKDVLVQAIGIIEAQKTLDHSLLARAWNDLAVVIASTGEADEGLRLAKRAVAIRRKLLGDDHPDVAQALATCGDIVRGSGAEPARPFYQEALSIYLRRRGVDHLDTATILNSLASEASDHEEWERSREYHERSLAIRRRLMGPNHPGLARNLGGLANVLSNLGEFQAASERFEEALRINREVYGVGHFATVGVMDYYSRNLARQGESRRAIEMALEAERISRRFFLVQATVLPERTLLELWIKRPQPLPLALSVVATAGGPRLRAAVFDAVIRSRALGLEEMIRRHSALRASTDPVVQGLWKDLTEKRRVLSEIVLDAPGARDDTAYKERFATASRDTEDAERRLNRRSPAFRLEQAEARPGLDAIRRVLPSDAALVAYVATYNPVRSFEETLLAFVLVPGVEAPQVVSLGHLDPIRELVRRWRKTVSRPGSESESRAEGAKLRAAIWDPVAERLADVKRAFVVPDAVLHLVPFDALPLGDEEYLVEKLPRLIMLSSERDLTRKRPEGSSGRGLLLVGAPEDVGDDLSTPRATPTLEVSDDGRCSPRALPFLGPLPAAATEMAKIAALWRSGETAKEAVVTRLGSEATEQRVTAELTGKRVLHFATHAFVLDDSCATTDGDSGDALTWQTWNPLLRSGLVLARSRHHGTQTGDGFLTSLEFAALDLRGTELAVLSACDTGLGTTLGGEGILGLRRALLVAGARIVVASLWKVPDDATVDWMEAFYRGRLQNGLPAAEAARQASLAMIAVRRRVGRSTHPYDWGGIVAVGDDR